MTVVKPPDRIAVTGSVNVGDLMNLEQRAEHKLPTASRFSLGRPAGMPAFEFPESSAPPGELQMQRLQYTLTPAGGTVSVENSGLTASYGVFGAPGSGKTFLLMHMLKQILALNVDDPDAKFGGIILDPKAALIDKIRELMHAAGRDDDLIVINTDELAMHEQYVNIIDSGLDPYELGIQLVMAARSAGVATSDPYWILAWGNLFGAAMYLLSLGDDMVTIGALLDAVLNQEPRDDLEHHGELERPIQRLARETRDAAQSMDPDQAKDALNAVNQVENFFRQENDNLATIENIVTAAYNQFQRSRMKWYSPPGVSKQLARLKRNFYDQTIEDGKIVLVSLSPNEPQIATMLCTLVKCLYQRSVLSRLERVQHGHLTNFKRPLILACDEYSQVASEVEGQPVGDGDFLSLARQNGCMALLATQSIHVMQASSLGENWKSVFSNMSGKIFMRLVDPETAEVAQKLAGESDWYVRGQGTSQSKDGFGSSTQTDLKERKSLPTEVLTSVFQLGDAAVLGSLDGSHNSFVRFIHVPRD